MARVRRDERFLEGARGAVGCERPGSREFAAPEGLRKECLFYWKRRVRESVAVAVAGVSFAKVAIEAARPEPAREPLEVVTRSGHTVRMGARFDEAALLRLLTV
jgi:hypothetical protein